MSSRKPKLPEEESTALTFTPEMMLQFMLEMKEARLQASAAQENAALAQAQAMKQMQDQLATQKAQMDMWLAQSREPSPSHSDVPEKPHVPESRTYRAEMLEAFPGLPEDFLANACGSTAMQQKRELYQSREKTLFEAHQSLIKKWKPDFTNKLSLTSDTKFQNLTFLAPDALLLLPFSNIYQPI